MKTLGSIESIIQLIKGGVKVGDDNEAIRNSRYKFDGNKIGGTEVDGEDNKVGKKSQKMSKSKNLSKFKKTERSSDFLTPRAKLAFNKLRQAFVKAPILHHFDLERYIQIETNASSYAIGGVLSRLIFDQVTLESKLNTT